MGISIGDKVGKSKRARFAANPQSVSCLTDSRISGSLVRSQRSSYLCGYWDGYRTYRATRRDRGCNIRRSPKDRRNREEEQSTMCVCERERRREREIPSRKFNTSGLCFVGQEKLAATHSAMWRTCSRRTSVSLNKVRTSTGHDG